jgi:hypothetical protein
MIIKKIVAFTAAFVVGGGLGIGGLSLLARNSGPTGAPPDGGKTTTPPAQAAHQGKEKPARSDLANERLGEYLGLGILTNPAAAPLRKGLALTDAQLEVAVEFADRMNAAMKATVEQISRDSGFELGFEARQRIFEDMRPVLHRAVGEAMADVFRPAQLARLDQIILTGHGVRALGYADVQEELALTAEQKAKIDSIIGKHHEELRAMSRQPGGQPQDYEGMMALEEKMEPLRRKALNDAIAVLTPEQKRIWQGLVGKPFVAGESPPK